MRHGASERAHAAVDLELTALEHLGLARGFLTPGQHGAEHHDAAARGKRLDDIAGVLDAAVGDDRDAVLVGDRRPLSITAVICGTPTPATTRVVQMEPGPMPTLTQSAPASNERLRGGGGGDVARDELRVGVLLP